MYQRYFYFITEEENQIYSELFFFQIQMMYGYITRIHIFTDTMFMVSSAVICKYIVQSHLLLNFFIYQVYKLLFSKQCLVYLLTKEQNNRVKGNNPFVL